MTDKLSPILVEKLVRMALEEDLGRGGDITTDATIPAETKTTVVMRSREDGRIAGLDLAEAAFLMMDDTLKVTRLKEDGSDVMPGDEILRIRGKARAILTAERVALNFLGHLSGIATATREMVRAVGNHKARICSTRKTTPGLRAIEKYAVRIGGGMNHRLGLDDAVLIKDNHIAISGGIKAAIENAKNRAGHTVKIEIEVDTLDQLEEVLEAGVNIVMLDNMAPSTLSKAVEMVDGRCITEASGGINLETVHDIAASGVDMISSGALTHSAKCLDIGLDFKEAA